jgi:NNP family nitrate/nitrite transporter-like MFS transporter
VSQLPTIFLVTALLFTGMMCLGMGNGAVFQLVPQRFQKEMGMVTGIVGAAGGIGGFFLPTLLGILKETTGTYASGFLSFAVIAIAAFGILSLAGLAWKKKWNVGREAAKI